MAPVDNNCPGAKCTLSRPAITINLLRVYPRSTYVGLPFVVRDVLVCAHNTTDLYRFFQLSNASDTLLSNLRVIKVVVCILTIAHPSVSPLNVIIVND